MNVVLLYAGRSFLSLMVALVCSAEARAASTGQEQAPIAAFASQPLVRAPAVSYRIGDPRAVRG
ncbi:hypothetical protein [Rhodoplanes sp. Z2-YC6860]|uniref:hypothetical protein n=1 Tax=Rhodoplanes sp. Z2-YC6860 TaxID=674703 RepID=UPI00082AC69D|nr:hypothetical protein [Rhodoplanes sp. Z2-YC6860]